MTLSEHAYQLMKEFPTYAEDAREGAEVGNTIVGSVMSITTKSPRQYTEAAVVEALRRLDNETT